MLKASLDWSPPRLQNDFVMINNAIQQSDVGVKSRSFLTLLESLSSSAAASVLIDIFSGVVRLSVPLVRGVVGRLPAPLDKLFGPELGAPGVPDFLWSNELKKLASTPSPDGVWGFNFTSI